MYDLSFYLFVVSHHQWSEKVTHGPSGDYPDPTDDAWKDTQSPYCVGRPKGHKYMVVNAKAHEVDSFLEEAIPRLPGRLDPDDVYNFYRPGGTVLYYCHQNIPSRTPIELIDHLQAIIRRRVSNKNFIHYVYESLTLYMFL